MKKPMSSVLLALAALTPAMVQAQGTVYLSNLSKASIGSEPVASDSWLAAEFRTGANMQGYSLDLVQLAMADASGNPNGITVMLYSSAIGGAVLPGSSLGTLNGSANPSTASIYAYTPASSLMLSPSTDYFVVVTATTAVDAASYEWSITDTATVSLNGWSGNTSISYSSDGSSWSFLSGNLAQFAITATPIPEPGVLGLLGLGSLFFIGRRRTAKVV